MADEPTVLNQIDIIARDFDATVAFYRALGVDIPPAALSAIPAGVRHADIQLANGFTLHIDNLELAQLYHSAWRRPEGSSRALIGFQVASREEVDRRYTALTAAGYQGRQVPYDTFWGARYAVVADPDGNDVGIMSPLDDSRRGWPPVPAPEA